MIKIVIGGVLIILAGAAWLYLDCLNKREQESTSQAQQGLLQARAEGARRAATKTIIANQLLASLTSCQAAAEKANNDYMNLIQKVAPSKRGKAIIPEAVTAEAEAILTSTKAECQQSYDNRMLMGQ